MRNVESMNMVCVGESHLKFGSSGGNPGTSTFPHLLYEKIIQETGISMQYTNAGVGGTTSNQTLYGLNLDDPTYYIRVLKRAYIPTADVNFLLIFTGANDAFYNEEELTEGNVQIMHDKARECGYDYVILMGCMKATNQGDRELLINEDFRARNKYYSDVFVDLYMLDTIFQQPSNTTYFVDGVHCTDAAKEVQAELTYNAMFKKRIF